MKGVPIKDLEMERKAVLEMMEMSSLPEVLATHLLFLVAVHGKPEWGRFSDPAEHVAQIANSMALACGCQEGTGHVGSAMVPAAISMYVWKLMEARPDWKEELQKIAAASLLDDLARAVGMARGVH